MGQGLRDSLPPQALQPKFNNVIAMTQRWDPFQLVALPRFMSFKLHCNTRLFCTLVRSVQIDQFSKEREKKK